MIQSTPDRLRASQALEHLFGSCEGVLAAMFATRDGRPFAEKSRARLDAGKLAAMSSSLVALGRSVLRELQAGEPDHLLIDGSLGRLVLTSVPDTGGLLILAVLTGTEARLGLVLGHARNCARALVPPASARPAPATASRPATGGEIPNHPAGAS